MNWVRNQCRLFKEATSGGVAMMFAVMSVPLLAMVGAAVDYSQAARIREQMQSALDAATLAAASKATGRTAGQIEQDALTIFHAQFKPPGVASPTVTAKVADSAIDMKSTAVVPTSFLGVIGIYTIEVGVTSRTSWSLVRLRVALALDNTGSMAQAGKMSALQTATLNLLTHLQTSARDPEDVYVSVVPFAKVVNVGTGYAGATWINWTDAYACFFIFCSLNWDGAIQDRDLPHDVSNVAPTDNNRRFPALRSISTGGTPQPVLPMTNNWTALRARISAMTPAGNTNQGIGLAWAWQSLTDGAPLHPPARAARYAYQRAIILISDGLNTENRFSTNPSTIDARQRILCDNIKSNDITIYTIQVNTTSDPRSSVLDYCASSPDKFILMTNPLQLNTALAQIGGQLTRLRLSK